MNNRCKCGENAGWYNQACYDCQKKEDRLILAILGGIVLIILGVIFGVRILWANAVFDDWRCALSQCMIIK